MKLLLVLMSTQGAREQEVGRCREYVLAGPQAGGARFNQAVLKLVRLLLPKDSAWERSSVRLARNTLAGLFYKGDEFLYECLVEPVLDQPGVTGIPQNSLAIAAAKDYAAKFQTLVFKLTKTRVEHSERLEFEKTLVMWLEWHLAWSFYNKSPEDRELIITHLQAVTIPIVHNNELLKPYDPAFKEARENYSLILGELTGVEVTLEHVTHLWMQSGVPNHMEAEHIMAFHP
jgi:hypothetical protein